MSAERSVPSEARSGDDWMPSLKWRAQVTQSGLGYRPRNDWGEGDLPAPWAEGDVARLEGPYAETEDDGYPRMRGAGRSGLFVVCYATSIDEGDAWYFRVVPAEGADRASDRLHVAVAERSTFDEDIDWMAPFTLVDTADPEGLTEREQLIADGWSFETRWVPCPTCGNTTPRGFDEDAEARIAATNDSRAEP